MNHVLSLNLLHMPKKNKGLDITHKAVWPSFHINLRGYWQKLLTVQKQNDWYSRFPRYRFEGPSSSHPKYLAEALELVRPERNTLSVCFLDIEQHNQKLATTILEEYYRLERDNDLYKFISLYSKCNLVSRKDWVTIKIAIKFLIPVVECTDIYAKLSKTLRKTEVRFPQTRNFMSASLIFLSLTSKV